MRIHLRLCSRERSNPRQRAAPIRPGLLILIGQKAPESRSFHIFYVDACRKHGLKVGFYFSPRDWHYPGYPQAMEYGAKFPLPPAEENFENFKAFYAYTLGQIHELLTRYGKIDLLWFDGMGWSGVPDMRAEQTLAWVRSIQPGIVINPRWSGRGDFATTECTPGKPENWKPGQWWEACDIWPSGHWGYVPSERFKPLSWVFTRLANCRACPRRAWPAAEREEAPRGARREAHHEQRRADARRDARHRRVLSTAMLDTVVF